MKHWGRRDLTIIDTVDISILKAAFLYKKRNLEMLEDMSDDEDWEGEAKKRLPVGVLCMTDWFSDSVKGCCMYSGEGLWFIGLVYALHVDGAMFSHWYFQIKRTKQN